MTDPEAGAKEPLHLKCVACDKCAGTGHTYYIDEHWDECSAECWQCDGSGIVVDDLPTEPAE